MQNLLFTICLLTSLALNGQGIEFFSGTWMEALEESVKQDKPLLVDAYTTWCGPCKKMSKGTFTDNAVGEFYNQNFISIKLDMEKMDGVSFGHKYPVSAYPTIYFIRPDGEILKKAVGYKPANAFLKLGEETAVSYDRSGDFAEKYEQGDRSFDLMISYVTELNRVGKSSLKISNEYLTSLPDITKEQRMQFLVVALVDADSKIYEEIIANSELALSVVGNNELQLALEQACNRTIKKSIEYEYPELATEALNGYRTVFPSSAYSYKAKLDHLAMSGEYEAWMVSADTFAEAQNSSETYDYLIKSVTKHFAYDKRHENYLLELYSKQNKIDPTEAHQIQYLEALIANGDIKTAQKQFKKAKKSYKDSDKIKSIEQRLMAQ